MPPVKHKMEAKSEYRGKNHSHCETASLELERCLPFGMTDISKTLCNLQTVTEASCVSGKQGPRGVSQTDNSCLRSQHSSLPGPSSQQAWLLLSPSVVGRFGVQENKSPALEAQRLTKGADGERTVVIEICIIVASRTVKNHLSALSVIRK